ncbi:hypothetical protein NF27_IY00010, partial [Candidatus Jidaibacter acanthamoeba]
SHLGFSMYKSGNYHEEEILEHLRKALNIDMEIFGQDHYEASVRHSNLGVVLCSMNKFKDAIYHLNLAILINKKKGNNI